MIYSTATWIKEFGTELSEADSKYFDLIDSADGRKAKRRNCVQSSLGSAREQAIEAAERELDEAGV